MDKILKFLDSTLRDGAQAEGISFSVHDKLNIVRALDEFGIDYIEAGNPFSNPKDLEFFEKVKDIELKKSKLVAFGSTRRKSIDVANDANVISLLSAATPVVCIFGKSWDIHVTKILGTTLEENLNMIGDTIKYLKSKGKEVIYDAEHFFDGYKANREYALRTLEVAEQAGADSICLCETNGGTLIDEVYDIVADVMTRINVCVGIHTHDDTGLAVANSMQAVFAGARQVQGTFIGFGERCGNANLSTIIANLQLKRQYKTSIGDNISQLYSITRKIAEIANVRLLRSMPFVGKSAFAHKAGMHIDGVNKSSISFEHVSPESVGNNRRFLMSEVAGRSTILKKINQVDSTITKSDDVTSKIINIIKQKEFAGYHYEGAEASLELLIRKELGVYTPYFEILKFKTIGEQKKGEEFSQASAIVKVSVDNQLEITAAEGNGPVNALDSALRKALERFYPNLVDLKLTDYKVRIIDSKDNTSAVTRVLIESSDGYDNWTTVGVSKDIIEASLEACVEAIEYKLIKDNKESI